MSHLRTVLLCTGLAIAALPVRAAIILPPEGSVLNHTHAFFTWTKTVGVDQYDVEVVVDSGAGDPFDGVTPVFAQSYGAAKGIVDSGLTWENDYAWRVREAPGGVPESWSPTYRFSTGHVPGYVPAISTTTTGLGAVQSGYTMFNIRSPIGTIPNGLALVVNEAGEIIWFLQTNDKKITDVRLIDADRVLYIASERAWERLLNGQMVWGSPLDYDMRVHHEAFKMSNGNVMALVHDYREVEVETSPSVFETQLWKGDRIIEFNRNNNNINWEWRTHDHYSTLDFDATVMASPTVNEDEPPGGSYPHTHGNSVIFDDSTQSVYISVRHLSRITRIDYASRNIVYNMGMTMPSGDVDFGDNLFSWQHAPQMLSNGNMMVYDNGNRRDGLVVPAGTGTTKVLELEFTGGDPPTGANVVWDWTAPEYSDAVGDVDRLANGNTLVVSGPSARIYEVSPTGQIVWRLDLPTGLPDYLIYRAERIPYLISGNALRDTDDDTITDFLDNCPDHPNVGQIDRDQDGFGDTCARAYGVGVYALPSLSPIGFVVLVSTLILGTFAAMRVSRAA